VALVWAEPFDQYGNGAPGTLIPQFGYTDNSIIGFVTPGRTGLRAASVQNSGITRRALNTPVTTLGMGWAYNINVPPGSDNAGNAGCFWESAGKTREMSCVYLSDNSIGIYDRTLTFKGKTPPNSVIQGTYGFWLECKATGNSAGINTGVAEVRINGVQKLVVNGINLPNAFAFHGFGTSGGNMGAFFDDWITWDTTGTKNNDFMGDRRLFASFPNANGATQNFTASAGSAFNCVNVVPPVDTTYIDGAAAGNISDFGKDAVTIASNDIAAMVICGRLFKTDAGVASGRIGVNSSGNISNSAELFPGTGAQWFQFIQELDPNGNINWAQPAYDNALIRITRVT